MLTLRQLFDSTKKLRTKVYGTNKFSIKNILPIIVPRFEPYGIQYEGNELLVVARFTSLTDPMMSFYDTEIVFHGLSYTDNKDSAHPVKIEVVPNVFMYSARPSFNGTPVGVHCMCKDYFFTAWYYNSKFGSHSGPDMPGYMRRTPPPPLGYPYRNSLSGLRNDDGVPFACKHIIRLAKHLKDRGFLDS